MSAEKRKASITAKAPKAKQPKFAPLKEGKRESAEGWLQEQVAEQRRDAKDLKFNKKRLRFLSETRKIKQGSEGVLYWMTRDHRVQGNYCSNQPPSIGRN